jgi:hypothetical protein
MTSRKFLTGLSFIKKISFGRRLTVIYIICNYLSLDDIIAKFPYLQARPYYT